MHASFVCPGLFADDCAFPQMMIGTEQIIRHALQENLKITLVVNKLDRLILELRIKPMDAFYKIKHTIEEINTFIRYVVSLFLCFIAVDSSSR